MPIVPPFGQLNKEQRSIRYYRLQYLNNVRCVNRRKSLRSGIRYENERGLVLKTFKKLATTRLHKATPPGQLILNWTPCQQNNILGITQHVTDMSMFSCTHAQVTTITLSSSLGVDAAEAGIAEAAGGRPIRPGPVGGPLL